jgi:hypothetical protein
MTPDPRAFVQNDEIVFEVTYSWPEMVHIAEKFGVPPEAISIGAFVERLDQELQKNCDLGEHFYQFLADSSEEK